MLFKRSVLLFFSIILINSLFAQKEEIVINEYKTNHLSKQKPIIDGNINDSAWLSAPIISNFVQNTPNPGEKATQKTEVRMLYDHDAVYISARMYERNTDSIYNFLTERDWYGNADFFMVIFNNYRDGINGEAFAVTPAGVQIDTKYSLDTESTSWDAVWESATQIDAYGWTAEFRIPFSALRFPDVEEQLWGINFGREIRRNRERSYWNHVNPRIDGFLTQCGRLKGIKDIEPPTRLFFFPYTSAYVEHNSANSGSINTSFNGGMDVKYGLNDAFTLDMTLIPDFGQRRFDNRVLNLTPFEVQFNENRQFFTEGVDLFNKAGLFYSRRVGGTPINNSMAFTGLDSSEEVIELPTESQLYNATKVSGRNKKGLGIGIFNAVEGETFATIENKETKEKRNVKVNPNANYNVLVLDQVLRNNSFLTFTNTNVMREGSTYDANVSRLDFKLADKQNNYAVQAFGAMSNRYFQDETVRGESWKGELAKISGNFRLRASQTYIGENYNINDLGFQTIRNISQSYLFAAYNIYKPFSVFNSMRQEFSAVYERIITPSNFANLGFSYNSYYTFRNFLTVNLNAAWEPIETNDFFETRSFQQYYRYPENYSFGGFISSDYSKPFAYDLNFNARIFDETGRTNFSFGVEPRIRPNDKLFFVIGYANEKRTHEMGYAATLTDTVVFGRRNVQVHETFIDGSYIFNNKMALSLNLRHYWSTARYNRYNRIGAEGELLPYSFSETDPRAYNSDVSFNVFNIDLIYKWRFAPGSEISVAWKNAITQEGEPLDLNYYRDVEATLKAPQINNFSIKILYFIDYLSLKG
ncbi:MAG: hypothetical protein CMC96_09220 [Flavobacteriales bacterium]|nr:hypothetical protein [Flavobacteriales bacterium]|tara:strand:+ start:10322 stop:12760 length:2439 start_codon:yes stop_codon:yes gene_type:complete